MDTERDNAIQLCVAKNLYITLVLLHHKNNLNEQLDHNNRGHKLTNDPSDTLRHTHTHTKLA